MTKHNNTVSIFQAIDDVCNQVAKLTQLTNPITSNNTSFWVGDFPPTDASGSSSIYPPRWDEMRDPNLWQTQWIKYINIPSDSIEIMPDYPKTNGYVLPNGDTIIEVAITGFERDELKITREDQVLIVKAHKQNQTDTDDRKYLYHQIAERNFEYKVACSDKQDLDKIDATVHNGKLIIKIPLKESARPIKQEIKIS